MRTSKIRRAVVQAFKEAEKAGLIIDVDFQSDAGRVFDPVTETYTGTKAIKNLRPIKINATKDQISDGIAQVGDLFLTFMGDVFDEAPTTNDAIFIGTQRYAILFIGDDNSGIVYNFQVRS